MSKKHFLKYGGVKFINNVPPEKINEFVANLADEKKGSIYEVAKELQDKGLITIESGEFSTIDKDMIDFQK